MASGNSADTFSGLGGAETNRTNRRNFGSVPSRSLARIVVGSH